MVSGQNIAAHAFDYDASYRIKQIQILQRHGVKAVRDVNAAGVQPIDYYVGGIYASYAAGLSAKRAHLANVCTDLLRHGILPLIGCLAGFGDYIDTATGLTAAAMRAFKSRFEYKVSTLANGAGVAATSITVDSTAIPGGTGAGANLRVGDEILVITAGVATRKTITVVAGLVLTFVGALSWSDNDVVWLIRPFGTANSSQVPDTTDLRTCIVQAAVAAGSGTTLYTNIITNSLMVDRALFVASIPDGVAATAYNSGEFYEWVAAIHDSGEYWRSAPYGAVTFDTNGNVTAGSPLQYVIDFTTFCRAIYLGLGSPAALTGLDFTGIASYTVWKARFTTFRDYLQTWWATAGSTGGPKGPWIGEMTERYDYYYGGVYTKQIIGTGTAGIGEWGIYRRDLLTSAFTGDRGSMQKRMVDEFYAAGYQYAFQHSFCSFGYYSTWWESIATPGKTMPLWNDGDANIGGGNDRSFLNFLKENLATFSNYSLDATHLLSECYVDGAGLPCKSTAAGAVDQREPKAAATPKYLGRKYGGHGEATVKFW